MKSVCLAKSIPLALLILAGSALAQTAEPTSPLSFNVSLTSNYKFRGQDQNTSKTRAFKPAINAGVDYALDSGFYLGNWNSTIDWTQRGLPSGDNAKVEIDLYGGYKFKVSDIQWDVGALQYYYPGARGANTTELYIGAAYGPLVAKYARTISKGYFGLGKEYLAGEGRNTSYLNVAFVQEVAAKTSFKAAIGYTNLKSAANSAGAPDYLDYSLGAAYDLGDGFALNGAVIGGNNKSSYFYAIDPTKSVNKATLVLTVTKAL